MFRLTIVTLSGFWNFQNQAKNGQNASVRSVKIWPMKFLQNCQTQNVAQYSCPTPISGLWYLRPLPKPIGAFKNVKTFQFSSLSCNFSLKMNCSQKCRIRKFTTFKLDQYEVHFQILHFSTGIYFWWNSPTEWWILSWKNDKYCDFWSQNSNYSKLSEFARKKSIVIHCCFLA